MARRTESGIFLTPRAACVGVVIGLLSALPVAKPVQARVNGKPAVTRSRASRPSLERRLHHERARLVEAFETDAELRMFDDGDVPNAMAFGRQTSLGFWGVIYLGVNLLHEDTSDPGKGEDAVIGIMAHEFAHVLQSKWRSSLTGVRRELHADFMAGWYYARRRPQDGANVNLDALARTLADRADIGPAVGTAFGRNHGTPEERVAAMQAGFASGALPLAEAFHDGESWVRGGAAPALHREPR